MMRITESTNPDIVFICLSPLEAKSLAEQLMAQVGEKVKPKNTLEKLTNQLIDLFYEEEK